MNSYVKFVALCALFSIAAASSLEAIPKANIDECMAENSVTLEDVMKSSGSHADIPESHLCFLKCLEVKENVIGPDGTISIDKLKESSKVKVMEDGKKAKLVECMTKIDNKINSCTDMKVVTACYLTAM